MVHDQQYMQGFSANMLGGMYIDFLIRKWDFRSIKYCLLGSGFLEQIQMTALS